jgi:hypothetical protein
MKKLFSALLIAFSGYTLAQNLPTLVSYEIDTMCNSDYDFAFIKNIEVFDANGDSTYLQVSFIDPGDYVSYQVIEPTYVPGATTRIFSIKADPSTGLSPGLNLSNVIINIVGNPTNDGGITTGVNLSGASIYGNIPVTFNVMTLSMCENSNPIDLRPYAVPAGGNFDWTGETSYMFDPGVFTSNGGTFLEYYYQNPAGCIGYGVSSPPIIYTAPSVSTSPSYSNCGNADGYADAIIFGGVPPYNVYWSSGFSEVTSSMTTAIDLAAGNYYCNVTDANGCKGSAIVNISDIEVDLSMDIIDETCIYQSANGSIDLTITTAQSVESIYWSTGATTEDLSGLSKGTYLVNVETDMGCKASAEFFVNGADVPYASNVNSTDASCSSNNGVIDYDIYNGSGSYTYLWNTGQTSEDIMNAYSGTYTCLVTDNATGCYFEYSHNVYSSGGPGAYLDFVKQPTCGNADGSIELTAYPFSAPITSISWSSGHTTEDIFNVPAGEYEITVTAQDGCIFNHIIKLENKKPEHPEICMLTVDTTLIYNVVVWEKDLTQPNIDGFKIYRETSTYGNFELVSTRPYALESMFQDNDASPVDRSWRYYITAYDDCGSESAYGTVHKTIHAVATTTNGTDFILHWDNYEGMAYTDVDVHRFDSTNGWQTLGTYSLGTNFVPDTPPVLIGLDYLVEFNLADPCTSSKVQDHNSSRSNKSSSVFDPGNSTVQIQDNELGAITCYPNPSEDMFVIHVDQFDLVTNYQIVDLNGNLVQSGPLTSNNTTVDVAEIASGIYLVKINSANNILTIKMVVQ